MILIHRKNQRNIFVSARNLCVLRSDNIELVISIIISARLQSCLQFFLSEFMVVKLKSYQ